MKSVFECYLIVMVIFVMLLVADIGLAVIMHLMRSSL
jgi:hypothetical protein